MKRTTMGKLALFLCCFFLSGELYAQQQCTLSPDWGFSGAGKHAVEVDTVTSRINLLQKKVLYIFSPQGVDTKVPCIFFYPQYGKENPAEYIEFINYLVSMGNVVIYPPYQNLNFRRSNIKEHTINIDVLKEMASAVREKVDTTRIGFIGHGFGGGIIPAVANMTIRKMGWGKGKTFMYLMSPWYFHGISKRELEAFPDETHLIVQIFENDNINDPQIGFTLFTTIGIPAKNKEFYVLLSDKGKDCRLKSDFTVPLGADAFGGENNILDTAGVYRLCDVCIEAVFRDNKKAHEKAFGTGKARKLATGTFADGTPVAEMVATDKPDEYITKKPYINMWKSPRNPYVDASRFRKGRRLYIGHRFDKVKKLTKFLIKKRQAEKEDPDAVVDLFDNPIDSGYGADGKFTVRIDSVDNPLSPETPVRFFHPAEIDTPLPLILLIHGYSGPDYRYFEPLINHIVSVGYTVLFPPYPNLPLVNGEERVMEKVNIVKKGIDLGLANYARYMDTTRVGVLGQSFGAGMSPCIAYMLFKEKEYGKNGALLYIMAPWYSYGITQEQLQSFPSHVKFIMQVYEDDLTNDHQMAVDIFNSINIPPEEKDYIVLHSDSFEEYTMIANHFVPYGNKNIYGEENLLDYYGVFKLFDALADYSFNNNKEAKVVALGNGSQMQTFMGEWAENRPFKPCDVSDTPKAGQNQYQYFYAWENPLNPRNKKEEALKEKIKKRAKSEDLK